MIPIPRSLNTAAAILIPALTVLLISALPFRAAAQQGKADPLSRYQGACIGTISVTFHEFNEHEKIGDWTDTVLKVIHLTEGGIFTAALLEDSKHALGLLKRFSDIRVEARLDRGVLAVEFHLTPYRIIRNVVIRGNAAVLESDITSIITVQPGSDFIREQLPLQEKLVRQKFIAEGYVNPAVRATAEQSTRDGNYTVYITITPGPYYSYGTLTINGNDSVLGVIIRSKLLSESFRFIEHEFKNNLSALKRYYWKLGYPDADIRYKLHRDSETGTVDIDISILEGAEYEINFSGNRHFENFTLEKQLILAERGNKNDAGARKSAQNIINFYKTKGYSAAQVKLDIKLTGKDKNKKRVLTFVIDEGPRTEVARLQITGNTSFKEGVIKKLMATRASGLFMKKMYDADVLSNDILLIRSFYIKNGFLDISINPLVRLNREKTRASIQVDIFEGPRTLISSIEFRGNHVISDPEIRKKLKLKPGNPYQESDIQDAENLISSLISAKGYPYVTVKGTAAFTDDRTGAAVLFTIEEGKLVRMGTVNFSGNIRTMMSYLKKQISLKPGDPLSIPRILEEYKNISDIEMLQAVNMTTYGIEEKKDRADLFFNIVEKKPFQFNIGMGYSSEKGFYANLGLMDKNFLGRYKQVWIKGEASQIGYYAAVGITEPRLISAKSSATLSFFINRSQEFNQTYGTFVYGPAFTVKFRWFDSLTAGAGVSYQQRQMLGHLSWEDLSDIDLRNQLYLRKILLFTVSASYDRRDSFLRPRKGFITSLSVDFSIDLSETKETLLSTHEMSDNFIRYYYTLKFFLSPWSRLTFASQILLGYIQPYTSVHNVLSDQRFYLGGISDVRGFKENMLKYDLFNDPVGGRMSLAASIEARIDLGLNFELTGFFDAGRIDDSFVEFYKMRTSAGLGLRYITPVGAMGFLYGFKINRQKGEDLGEFHVSIGYTF